MAAGGAGGKTYSFKVVLLGEGCVGKTSMVLRYCENKFNDKHITTLQVKQHTIYTGKTTTTTNVTPVHVNKHTTLKVTHQHVTGKTTRLYR